MVGLLVNRGILSGGDHRESHAHDQREDAVKEGCNLRELGHGQNHPDGRGIDDEEGHRYAQRHRLDGGMVEIHICGYHRVRYDGLA